MTVSVLLFWGRNAAPPLRHGVSAIYLERFHASKLRPPTITPHP